MNSNRLHLGDIIYINLEDQTLLADPRKHIPCFEAKVSKQKNVFRNCLFQLLSASPDPINSIVKFSTKQDIAIKTSTPVVLYHIESARVLTVDSSTETHKLTFVNKVSEQSVFTLSHPEVKENLGEDLCYNLPIQIEAKKVGEFLRVGEPTFGHSKKEIEDIPKSILDYFPQVLLRKDTAEVFVNPSLAILSNHPDPFQINLYQSGSSIREDSAKILNGDYVRVRYVDKWLAHYPVQEYPDEVFFERINDPYRQYNSYYSIFQIMDKKNEEASSVLIGEDNQYMLKHYATGKFIHFNAPATTKVYSDITVSETETPFFNLEAETDEPIVQEKRPLRIKYQNNQGSEPCLKVAESKPVKQVQLEINTSYYFGFRMPEEYTYKNQKNLVRNLAGVSTEFEIEGYNIVLEKVPQEELTTLLKVEAFLRNLEEFLVASHNADETASSGVERQNARILATLDLCKRINQLLLLEEEDTKEARIGVTVPKYKLKVPNRKVQALVRELQIFDVIHMISFSYIINTPEIISKSELQEAFSVWKMLELYEEFANFFSNALLENAANRFYNSQFVRIYINTLFDSASGGMTKASKEIVPRLKKATLNVLRILLWDNDLDALGQINYYINPLETLLETDDTFQTYNLELLEHVSNSKASNFVNTYRDSIITKFLATPEKIFPVIILQDEGISVKFNRTPALELKLDLLPSNQSAYNYLIAALKTVIAISSSKTTFFYHNIIKFYPLNTLLKVLKSEAPDEIKMLVHLIVIKVHYEYVKFPFQPSPTSIQATTEKLQDLLFEDYGKIQNITIGEIEQQYLQEDGVKEEVDEILQRIKSELASLPLPLLKSVSTLKPTPQTLQIVLLYLETLFTQDNFSVEFYDLVYEELKSLVDKISQDGQSQFSFLPNITPNVIRVCQLFYERTKIQLTHSICNQLRLGKNVEESSRNQIAHFQAKNLEMFSLLGMLGLNEPALTSATLPLLNNLSHLEEEVANELNQLISFSTQQQIQTFKKIVESSQTLAKYNREFTIKKEKTGDITIEYEEYSKILDILEDLLFAVYDPSKHYEKLENDDAPQPVVDDATLKTFKAQFIKDYRKEKTPIRDNPIQVKPEAVSIQMQNVFRLLSVHDTLLNILPWGFNFTVQNIPVGGAQSGYLLRLILAILIIFVYKNKPNQRILSTSPPLIKKYYDQAFLDKSTDAMTLFAEIMRDNDDLLELSQKFLYDITCYSFIGTVKPRNFTSGGTYFAATLNAMHFLYKAQLPLSVYDTFSLIETKLKDFLTIPFGADSNSLSNVIGETTINTHIYYSIREFLKSSAEIFKLAQKEGKEQQIAKLRNNFGCHKLAEGFLRPDFRFYAEIRGFLLKFIANLHYPKGNVNLNFFNIEDIPSATKFFASLLNQVLEFLTTLPKDLPKDEIAKMNEDFLELLEQLKGQIIEEEDLNAIIAERKEYVVYREQKMADMKLEIYMDLTPVNKLLERYIYSDVWKSLAKLCVYYPQVIKLANLFETFLTVSTSLIHRIDSTNTKALRKFKKYFTTLESIPEYQEDLHKIKKIVSLIEDRSGGDLAKPNLDQNKHKASESSFEEAFESFVNSLQANKDKSLQANLEIFAELIGNNSKRRNILSQLITVLQKNPFNLSDDLVILSAQLLDTYLRKAINEKQGLQELERILKEVLDLDAERRLVEGILIASDASSLRELVKLVLTLGSGGDAKIIEGLQQNIKALKHLLLPSTRELAQQESHLTFILETILCLSRKSNNEEVIKLLDYVWKSHTEVNDPNKDAFRGFTSQPPGHQVEELRKALQALTQDQFGKEDLVKSFGPLPIKLVNVIEVFRVHETDNHFVQNLKKSIREVLKQSHIADDINCYLLQKTQHQEDLEKIKLDAIFILDIYISDIKYGAISQA